jgi:hypothetical protein
MATFEHYKHTFSNNVRDLAGGPMRSVLPEFVDKDNQGGKVAYLDSAGPGADITATALTAKTTRKTYEADGSKTLAKWNAIHTPHNEIVKVRTLSQPQLIEWGHTFDEDEDILEIVDPTNKTTRQGMRSMVKAKDQLILNGITAASVSRVNSTSTDEVSPVTINLPASQAIDTAANDVVTLEDFTSILEKFENQYIDEKIYVLISPTTKKVIIDNNEKIHNTDFVNKHSYFHGGELPDVYGMCFITHPLVDDDMLYAFTKEAIILNQYKAFTSSISKVPELREGTQAYMREKLDCKRVDDLKVVHMTITTV